MRFQSLRRYSVNLGRVAALAAISSSVGSAADDVPSGLRSELTFRPPLRDSGDRPEPEKAKSQSPKLVPLAPPLDSMYGTEIPLIGPITRSAGAAASRSPSNGAAAEDSWLPRGMQDAAGAGPLAEVPDQRGREAAGEGVAADAVVDPEQNEPEDTDAQREDGPIETAISDLDREPVESDDSAAEAEARRDVSVRPLRLDPYGQDRVSERDSASAGTAKRSLRAATVGDITPRKVDMQPESEPQASAEDARQPARAKQETRSLYVNPIAGDRITPEGELILAVGRSAANLPIKPQTAQLKPLLERGLRYYWDRPEDAAERTHWGMMHSIMVFDRDTQIVSRGQRFNAVGWMAGNNPCRNQLLFTEDRQGIVVQTGVGLQGHQGQLLAIFGLINVPLNYPAHTRGRKYAVADILEREKLDCRSGAELTFTLIALAHYSDSDTAWVAGDGQNWDVERVVREELSQPIVGAACGGTHRLMGFAHALRRRRAEEKPITGQWDRADQYLNDFIDYTWSLQNRDGSMSTAWFERSEDNHNIDRKIQTTGHMLEFLLSTAADDELQSPEMLRTVNFLAGTMYNERGRKWQVGPKGHALRALAMYYQRVFGDITPWRNAASERNARAPAARPARR